MAWTTPMTAVANTGLTAAQWNASVRDNLLETGPAKITGAGEYLVGNGVSSLASRTVTEATVDTLETTTSSSYAALTTPGPALTMTTAAQALVFVNCQIYNNTTAIPTKAAFAVSGATTTASSDNTASAWENTANQPMRVGTSTLVATTAGSNTFTMEYRCDSNTGSFRRRRLQVMGF